MCNQLRNMDKSGTGCTGKEGQAVEQDNVREDGWSEKMKTKIMQILVDEKCTVAEASSILRLIMYRLPETATVQIPK